jgi:hypothetical protein
MSKEFITKAHYPVNDLCEICESNEKEYDDGKWCTSCKDDFKESEDE